MRAIGLVGAFALMLPAAWPAQQQPTRPRPAQANLSITAAVVLRDLTVRPIPLLQIELIALADTSRRFQLRTGLDGRVSQSLPGGAYRLRSLSSIQVDDSTFAWDIPVTVTQSGATIELTNANATISLTVDRVSPTTLHSPPSDPGALAASKALKAFYTFCNEGRYPDAEALLHSFLRSQLGRVGGMKAVCDPNTRNRTLASVDVTSATATGSRALVIARLTFKDGAVIERDSTTLRQEAGGWVVTVEAQAQTAPAPQTASACDGIELMGLYTTGKVAGVEVFMTKVRNATNLTRIVEVQYRLRGKVRAQTARTEVAPGAIETIELGVDRPQDLKISVCR